jgi:hypothetical protein
VRIQEIKIEETLLAFHKDLNVRQLQSIYLERSLFSEDPVGKEKVYDVGLDVEFANAGQDGTLPFPFVPSWRV